MPKYDIKNPTPARRVIYDGFPKSIEHPEQRAITIEAGGEKLGVELFEEAAKQPTDLIITPAASAKFAAPDQPPKDDARDFPRKK